MGLVYIEVSAKTGQNVALSFEMITEKILEKIDNKEINPEEEVHYIISQFSLASKWVPKAVKLIQILFKLVRQKITKVPDVVIKLKYRCQ